MDTQIDIEKLRSRLQAMSRKQVLALCRTANLAGSTIEKFRLGRITEPRLSKLEAIAEALEAESV